MQYCLTGYVEFPNIELPIVYIHTDTRQYLNDQHGKYARYGEYNVNKCCNIVRNECSNTVQQRYNMLLHTLSLRSIYTCANIYKHKLPVWTGSRLIHWVVHGFFVAILCS